jgi:hypothetical protein
MLKHFLNLVSCLKGVDEVHNKGMLHSRQDVPFQFGVHVNFSICTDSMYFPTIEIGGVGFENEG